MSNQPNPRNPLALAGSDRAPLAGAREVGPANPNETVDATIRLRSRAGKKPIIDPEEFTKPVEKRKLYSREQFAQEHGANPADIARVEKFAQEYNLKVKEKSAPRRTVILSGTVSAMNKAFGVELKRYDHPGGEYRGRTGQIHLPADLHEVVEGVFGLDNRPQAKPHFRRRHARAGARAATVNVSYTPVQVATLYDYPTSVDGTGECIALVELGGGFNPTDLNNYWSQLNLSKTPTVSAVSVGNGSNSPTGDPSGPDGEVMLDIEVAGSIAPGARIVAYFAENTDAGFLNAITTAVHDTTNNPSVLSISWGGPESSWTQQAMTSMDEAFQSAAALGVTVCVAAGDNGSSDGVTTDTLNHVDFPASSPNVLACGGTTLEASGNTIASEVVWNELANNEGATGGGISDVFPLPSYQASANVPPSANPGGRVGRGVPDVAGDADPSTGYDTLVDGQSGVIGGTSAVAPLWAGLIALINQDMGKPAGFINPLLYQNVSEDETNDITQGNNGAYSAGHGWDACTGLGSPIGTAVEASLSGQPALKTGTGD
ncbi:MAG: S53 family peptidase [Candidatus Sulfotelmatobacter sp.]|jgi:kumamolisin